MRTIELSGRSVVSGAAQGLALVTSQPVSFFGGLDIEKGMVIEKDHELEGENVTGRVLVFPRGKGSTVGSYVIYAMKKKGTAPAAIINVETEPIIAVGCVLTGIPLMDKLNQDPIKNIRTGDFVRVLADEGIIKVDKAQ
ncbi:MAG: DUF126 domain-containing protein [Candidatus Bathyarchaeota archaeon]